MVVYDMVGNVGSNGFIVWRVEKVTGHTAKGKTVEKLVD
jgi:nitrate reductase NapE component